MKLLTRRAFLKYSGAVTTASVGATLSFEEVAQAAISRPLPKGTPILVVITLYGGNDGLNTVVPYQDPLYFSLRSELAYRPEVVIPLDTQLALNPAMGAFKTLWDRKKLAIIRGVGYPKHNRSHFTSMAIWQSGLPGQQSTTGWIGRWLDAQKYDPMTAISLGSILPPLFVGAKNSGSALPVAGLVIPKGTLAADCTRLSLQSPDDSELMSAAALSMRNLFSLSSDITPILKAPEATPTSLPTANGGNAGGESQLTPQLGVISKLINAGAPTRVWSASLGGFDTHANEANAQAILLGELSQAVSKFLGDLTPSGRNSDVTVLIYSEFGRRVAGNASQGTDHGSSGPVFVLGEKVKGGFYGEEPSLSKLINGDLAVTTDFRDIYATLIEKVLSTDAAKVLNSWRGRVNIF